MIFKCLLPLMLAAAIVYGKTYLIETDDQNQKIHNKQVNIRDSWYTSGKQGQGHSKHGRSYSKQEENSPHSYNSGKQGQSHNKQGLYYSKQGQGDDYESDDCDCLKKALGTHKLSIGQCTDKSKRLMEGQIIQQHISREDCLVSCLRLAAWTGCGYSSSTQTCYSHTQPAIDSGNGDEGYFCVKKVGGNDYDGDVHNYCAPGSICTFPSVTKPCFGPKGTVETRGGVKTIPELLIGDEIRTSADNLDNTAFTEFLGWLDRQDYSPAEMLQLFTTDNTPAVTLSASHVVFTNNSTKYAGDLVPGDVLLHWDGVQMKELEITEITTSQQPSFWAPLTRSGTLLVDGFLMSCYASYPHKVSDLAMAPVKAMSMTLLDDKESQHKDGVRKIVKLMKDMGQLVGLRRGQEISGKPPMKPGSFVHSIKDEF